MRLVAHFGSVPIAARAVESRPLTRDSASGRAVVERRTIHIPDILDRVARGEYRRGPGAPAGHRVPDHPRHAPDAGGDVRSASSSLRRTGGAAVHRQADRAAEDLRRPGGHRHRERPPVHRAAGAHRGADALGGRAGGAGRGGAHHLLHAGSRDRAGHRRVAGQRAGRDRRRRDLRVRRRDARLPAAGDRPVPRGVRRPCCAPRRWSTARARWAGRPRRASRSRFQT